MTRPALPRLFLAATALTLLGGCTVELENRRAAEEVERMRTPPGSVYAGWRVYQDKCASCHGAAGNGTANAPDLLVRVRDLGAREFVSRVLYRYDLNLQGAPATSAAARAAREAQVEIVMERREAPLAMPAWGSEPRVNAHIADLYAWLAARADGRQGPERPAP